MTCSIVIDQLVGIFLFNKMLGILSVSQVPQNKIEMTDMLQDQKVLFLCLNMYKLQ